MKEGATFYRITTQYQNAAYLISNGGLLVKSPTQALSLVSTASDQDPVSTCSYITDRGRKLVP